MKSAIIFAVVLALLPFTAARAETDHSAADWQAAEAIIAAETPCAELDDDQLELLGDYYMEQMHPGEQHELMDQMMGGEGSAALRQAHIFMARRWYCGDAAGMGMMGMMMGAQGAGTYSGGMMGSVPAKNYAGATMMNAGFGSSFVWLTPILLWVALLAGIAAAVKYILKK